MVEGWRGTWKAPPRLAVDPGGGSADEFADFFPRHHGGVAGGGHGKGTVGGTPFDGLGGIVEFKESVDEAGGEGVTTANAVEDFQVLAVDGVVELTVVPGKGSPVVVRSTMHFAQGGGGCLEVGELGNRFFDHFLEVGNVDSGDVFFIHSFDFEAETGREVFFVSDHDVDILGNLTVHFLALGLSADGLPKRRAVVEIVGNDGAVFLGNLAGFDSELGIALGQGGENATGVKPADTEGAEDVLEVEVIDGELAGGGVAAVGGSFGGADSEATFGEVQSVAGSDAEAVEVSPFDELGIDSALKHKILKEAADFVVDEGGEDGGALAEAAAESPGDVIFAATFPGLESAGGANATVTWIETEHDFAHRDDVVGAGRGGFDVEAHDFSNRKLFEEAVGAENIGVSREEVDQIIEAAIGLALHGFMGAGADMAGDDAVGCADEDVVGGGRFGVEDVGSVSANFAGFEGCGHVVGVHEFATGAVDHDDVVAHLGDFGGIDHVFGFLGEEAVEGDDVGVVKDFVHIGTALDAVLFTEGVVEIGIEGDDLHAEGFSADCDFLADAAQAEDADGLAHDLVTDRLLPACDPLTILDGHGVGLDVLGDAEEKAEGVLGDGGVIDTGSKEDGNVLFGGVFDVDFVETDSVF